MFRYIYILIAYLKVDTYSKLHVTNAPVYARRITGKGTRVKRFLKKCTTTYFR